jgi:sugar porter (SP) family MFS transporter
MRATLILSVIFACKSLTANALVATDASRSRLFLSRYTIRVLRRNTRSVCCSKSVKIGDDSDELFIRNRVLPPWLPPFATAALGGLLFGSDIGSSSSVVRILGSSVGEFGALSAIQLGQIASSSLVGAMVASGILIASGDKKLGRKLELQLAGFLFLIGTVIQSLSPSLSLVYLGRLVYGLGIGTAMHVAPLYIAETAPNDLRGKLVSLKEAAIVAGIVLGYAAGAIAGDGNWRGVFEASLPFEALMIAGALFVVPESPRWLALRGRPEEAAAALVKAQGVKPKDAELQVMQMMAAVDSSSASLKEGSGDSDGDSDSITRKVSEIFESPYTKQALVIGVGLVLFQQLTGQPSVLYFANRIFESAGFGFEAAVGVGLFKLLMTIVSASLVEDPKWGRKTLLLYGNVGITVSLVALTALYATAGLSGEPNQAAILASILLFVGSYQIGFGPITWLILSEIFPLKTRAAAVSIGTLANFGSNVLVTLLFELERVNLGESLLFGQFALIAVAATLFTNSVVFETRGLSLEEIEAKLIGIVDDKAGGKSNVRMK